MQRGISLRHCNLKPCPQPSTTIENYLKENTGFEGSIGINDKVCYSCYQSHLFVLQQSKTTSISGDEDLQDLISTLDKKVHSFINIQSTSDLIKVTMNRVVLAVGRDLLYRNALLLPTVHGFAPLLLNIHTT